MHEDKRQDGRATGARPYNGIADGWATPLAWMPIDVFQRAGTETRPYTRRLALPAARTPAQSGLRSVSTFTPPVDPPSQLLTLPHPIGLFHDRNDLVEAGPFGGAVDAVLAA